MRAALAFNGLMFKKTCTFYDGGTLELQLPELIKKNR